jgi:hypothetical protein
MILRMLSERGGWLGRIAASFAGMAWTLTTFLAVPVLVTKDIGPIDAIKESAAIFKRTWGEQVVGNFGLSWAVFLMMLSWTAVSFGVGYLASALFGGLGIFAAVGIGIAGYVFLALMASALQGIYQAALYRFAMTGEAGYFDAQIMGTAFRQK